MPDRRAAYQNIPSDVLESQQRTDEGAAWARAQRQALGQQWADAHLQDAYSRLFPPQNAQDAQQTAPAPEMAPSATPAMPEAPAPTDAPQTSAGMSRDPVDRTMALLGEGDRPPSEFEQPSAFPPPPTDQGVDPFARRLGPETIQPTDLSATVDQAAAASPAQGGRLLGRLPEAIDQGATAIENQIGSVAQERTASDASGLGYFRKVAAHQPTTPEEDRAFFDTPDALALSGEPIANAGGKALGAAAGEVARLRLDKLPEGVRDVVQGAAENADFWKTTQRRGVIPDAEAESMADRLGRSVDQMIAGGKVGKAYTTEQLRALKNAVVAQGMDVATRAREIAADPTKVTDAMRAEQLAAGLKLAELTRVFEGGRAEAGRSMRAFQSFARDYAADPQSAIQRIYRATGLTPEQAATAVNDFTKMTEQGADPFQMASFWAKVERPPVNAGDWFRLVRYNAMLSGPRTMLVNLIGNAAEVPWRLARDTAASIVTGQSGPSPQLQGMGAGAAKGIKAFTDILAHGITAEQAARGDIPRSVSSRLDNPLAKGAATALEFNGRLMAASDEFFHQLNYGMAKGREAGITASKEGLRGEAWAKRVDELFADPTPSTGAGQVADRMTFHGPMGELGEKLAPLQQWSLAGVPVGNIVMPFLRTVYHITARGVDRSPIGAVGTGVDMLRGVYGDVNPLTRAGRANLGEQLGKMEGPAKGVAPLGERAGDALMGSAAFAGLGLAAAQGNMSGKGPSDPEKRKMMQAQGWQPYSVRIGGNWVSYANWGPMAVPLSLAAALAEGEGTGGKYAYDVFERGASVLTEQSYLQGVGAIFKALDPQSGATFGERELEEFLGTLVPFGSAINTIGQATDPVLRQPEKGDIAGALQARVPGLRESLPAQQDVLGRDIANPQAGAGAALPVRASPERPNTTLSALREAKVDIPDPPKTISNGDVRNLPITTAEQRRYRTVQGTEVQHYVEDYLASDKGKADSPERRAATLKAYLEAARKKAEAAVLTEMGKDQLIQRVNAQKRPAA